MIGLARPLRALSNKIGTPPKEEYGSNLGWLRVALHGGLQIIRCSHCLGPSGIGIASKGSTVSGKLVDLCLFHVGKRLDESFLSSAPLRVNVVL